jgi:hypothetical protein
MSEKEAKRTSAGVRFDICRTGIFALCVVFVPEVAASYGVRLSAIPEAYWGTWVPAAEICQDANKSAIVLSAKAYVTSAVSCAVVYVAEAPSQKGPIYSARFAMLQPDRAVAEKRGQSHHPAGRNQPDFDGPGVR